MMKRVINTIVVAVSGILLSNTVIAHDLGSAGLPVCLEANFMLADSMNNNPPIFPK